MTVSSISSQSNQQALMSKQVNLKPEDVVAWSDFRLQVKHQNAAQKHNNEVTLVKTAGTESNNQMTIDKPGDEENTGLQAQAAKESEAESKSQNESTIRGKNVDRVV